MVTEQALKSVLDARREELHRIDGVIGSGIWLSGETLEIQLFVADEEGVEAARREAEPILGSLPFDVQVSPIPAAYADARKRVAESVPDEQSEEGSRGEPMTKPNAIERLREAIGRPWHDPGNANSVIAQDDLAAVEALHQAAKDYVQYHIEPTEQHTDPDSGWGSRAIALAAAVRRVDGEEYEEYEENIEPSDGLDLRGGRLA